MSEPQVDVQALLFAERVLREANGRHTLVGIFDTMDLADHRQSSTPWFVFISVLNLPVGKAKLGLQIERRGGDVEFTGTGQIEIGESASLPVKLECGLPIGVFQPSPGQYDVSLMFDDQVVATRPFLVKKSEDSNGNEEKD